MNEVTLDDDDIQKLRGDVEDYLSESFRSRMKELQKKFGLSSDYTDGITYSSLEDISYDLVNGINDSGDAYEFIQYLMSKHPSGTNTYNKILEKHLSPESQPVEEKTYKEKEQYDIYKDLKNIVGRASKDVFIVDAWPDESLYELYIDSIPSTVPVKILTKDSPPAKFVTVGKLLANKRPLEIRGNGKVVHDRLIFVDDRCWMIGASIKDAGKKPTALKEMKQKSELYKIWIGHFSSGSKLV